MGVLLLAVASGIGVWWVAWLERGQSLLYTDEDIQSGSPDAANPATCQDR